MHRTSIFASLVSAVALLAGCSPEVIVSTPPGTDGPDPVEVTPIPSGPESVTVECGALAADPDRTILALADGADLVFVDATGHRHVVHTFDAQGTAPTDMVITVAARDGFVAANASTWDASSNLRSEAVLFTRSGELVWTNVSESAPGDTGFYNVMLGDDGALALTDGWVRTLIRTPDGATFALENMSPVAPPNAAGRMPVAVVHPDVYASTEYGWFDPTTGVTNLAADVYPMATRDGVVYGVPGADGSLVSIVRQDADGAITTALGALPEGTYLSQATDSGIALLRSTVWGEDGTPVDQSFVSLPGVDDVAAIASPTTLTPFGYWLYNGVRVGAQGEALLVARDASKGGLFRSVDDGATWQLVGRSFDEITDAYVVDKASTYVVTGTDELGYFPIDAWTPGTADIHGPRTFVARASDDVVRFLPHGADRPAISEGGSCVAYAVGEELSILEVGSGETIDAGAIGTNDTAIWVP